MSLNGLDDATVLEAYHAAQAEAGGWFLLRYAARDSVALYRRGHGGVSECRAAIAEYDELSPIFGLLLYRRRKVVLKYMPEGTTRLLQVRAAVHFQAVTEKFAPHDAILELSSPASLVESELTSACSLHTAASPSNSNAPSIAKQKLDEITEDAEESASPDDTTAQSALPVPASTVAEGLTSNHESSKVIASRRFSKEIVKSEPIMDKAAEPATPDKSNTLHSETPQSQRTIKGSDHPPLSNNSTTATAPQSNTSTEPSFSPTSVHTIPYASSLHRPSVDTVRPSFQSARPSMSEFYSSYDYSFLKPKVKLGPRPRPSLDKGGRPSTAGETIKSNRPVASLPPGLRVAPRTSQDSRPKSRDGSHLSRKGSAPTSFSVPPPPPIPDMPEVVVRPASVKSLPAISRDLKTTVSPERTRLMKAVELRKRQMKAAERAAAKAVEEAAEKPLPEPQSGELATPAAVEESNAPPMIIEQQVQDTNHAASTEEISPKSLGSPAATLQAPAIPPKSELRLSAVENKNDSVINVTDEVTRQKHDESMTSSISSVADSDVPEHASTRRTSLSDTCSRKDSAREPEEISESKRDTIRARIGPSELGSDNEGTLTDTSTVAASEDQEEGRDSEATTPRPDLEKRVTARFSPLSAVLDKKEALNAESEKVEQPTKADTGAIVNGLGLNIQTDSRSIQRPSKEHLRLSGIHSTHVYESSVDGDLLTDDDSLLEEIQSATVQEAKPVSMVQSPTGEYFPSLMGRQSPHEVVLLNVRSPSGNLTPSNTTPPLPWGSPPAPKSRSGSEGLGTPPGSSSSPSLAAKENGAFVKRAVSSGISQRIKLLAESSNNTAAPSTLPENGPPRPSHLRPTPSQVPRPNSAVRTVKRWSRSSIASFQSIKQEAPQPEPVRPKNTVKAVWNVHPQKDAPQPQSVSVTAHIVREGLMQPDLSMPTEGGALEMHKSPLVVEQHNTEASTASNDSAVKQMPVAIPIPILSQEAAASAQLPSPPSNRMSSDFSRSWHSKGGKSPGPTSPRSMSNASITSSQDEDGASGAKSPGSNSSRSAKFFRRMSSGLSSVGRGFGGMKSPTTTPNKEDSGNSLGSNLESVSERNGVTSPSAGKVVFGDLNVQFPDTLLWKRRWTEVDGNGNLVFGLEGKTEMEKKGLLKRFHLSEFKTPVVPDLERMEMPYSVVLDFLDGRTLQCACWDQAGQARLLQALRESHQTWSS